MNLLFTNSNRVGSRFIRWITGEYISHVAIEHPQNIIMHMTFCGFKITLKSLFEKQNTIIATIPLTTPQIDLWHRIEYIAHRKSNYDYPALLWLGILIIWRRLTGQEITRNHWQKSWLSTCTEFATWVTDESIDSVVTPGDLLDRVLKSHLNL